MKRPKQKGERKIDGDVVISMLNFRKKINRPRTEKEKNGEGEKKRERRRAIYMYT